MPNENQKKRGFSVVSDKRPVKRIIMLLLCHVAFYSAFAQNVTISINATQGKRLISPYIYGKNEGFDQGKPLQFFKDAGLCFARLNRGNNASAYNWRNKLGVHPDWFNNVYDNDAIMINIMMQLN